MSGSPILCLVAAVADNGVIGLANGLPWRLSTDMKRFKALTLGKPMVMGRKTFDSIGKALPGRVTIVVTRSRDFAADGVRVAHTLADALALAREVAGESGTGEIIIAGGGDIYAQAMPLADRLYITHVHAAPDGDTHFPAISPDEWALLEATEVPVGERDSVASRFAIYDRIDGKVEIGA